MSKPKAPCNAITREFLERLEAVLRRARTELSRHPRSAEEEVLRQRILKAFKGVRCQKERALLECYSWDDYNTDPQLLSCLRNREERRNWTALPPELLLVCDDGRYHAGPEAWRFMLPAYMLLTLDYEHPWINDVFLCPMGLPKESKTSSREWSQERYSLLNGEQRAVVEEWVNIMRQRKLWDDDFTLPWLLEN